MKSTETNKSKMEKKIKNILIELAGGTGMNASERIAGIWWSLSLIALLALCDGPLWVAIALAINFCAACMVVSGFDITEDDKEDYYIED